MGRSRTVSALLSITKDMTAARHCAEQHGWGVQGRSDVHGKDGLQQHFADMAFFSRARTTGKMGEVVDKLKANLRYAIYLTWVMLHGRPCHVAWQASTLAMPCNQAVAFMLSAAVSSILSSSSRTTVGPAFSQKGWQNNIDRSDVHWKILIGDNTK